MVNTQTTQDPLYKPVDVILGDFAEDVGTGAVASQEATPAYIDYDRLAVAERAVAEGKPAPVLSTYAADVTSDRIYGIAVTPDNVPSIVEAFTKRHDATPEIATRFADEMLGFQNQRLEQAKQLDAERQAVINNAMQDPASAGAYLQSQAMIESTNAALLDPITNEASIVQYLNKGGYDQDASYKSEDAQPNLILASMADMNQTEKLKYLQDLYPDAALKLDPAGRPLVKYKGTDMFRAAEPVNPDGAQFWVNMLTEAPEIGAAAAADFYVAKTFLKAKNYTSVASG